MCKNEEMLILLSGRMDGCNTPEEDARLEAHLAECPDCRRTLADYQKNDAGLAGFEPKLPDDFTENVMRAVRAEPRTFEVKKPRRFTFGIATAAAAVAAVVLLAIGSGMLPQLGPTSAKMNDTAKKSVPAAEPAAAEEAFGSEPEAAPAAVEEPKTEYAVAEESAEATSEAALSASTYFQAEVVEISDGAMLVKPLEGYSEADYADQIRVVIQNMPSSPEPGIGDVIEVTYGGTMTEEDPPSPNGVVSIKVISHK